MKVLFLTTKLNDVGGIQQYNRIFIETAREQGHKVTIVEKIGGGLFSKSIFAAKSLLQGMRGWDLIWCGHINFSPVGYFIWKVKKTPYAISTHGLETWELRESHKEPVRNAKLITTVAHYSKKKLVEQIPELENRVYMLYSFADGIKWHIKEKSQTLAKKLRLEGKKVILTVARLSKEEGYKGYDRIIQSLPRIQKDVPNTAYILVGKGDDAPRVSRLVEEMGLQKDVILAGYVSDEELIDYYNLADVFAMPSKKEGAPAVFLEALACGLPVIGGNCDGSSTPIMDGKVGFLIDPESIDEITETIVKILKKEVEPKLLDGEWLRREMLAKFGKDKFEERVGEVMNLVQGEDK